MQFTSYILNSFWSIAPEQQAAYRMAVARLLKGEPVVSESEAISARARNASFVAYLSGVGYEMDDSDDFDKQELDMLPFGSVAITTFTDAIMKYDQECGPEGVVSKMKGMRAADNHPNIKAHIIKIDSCGGECMAMLNTADFIKTLTKPVIAFIDDMAASAAYGIASAANYIVANRGEAYVGSIGTMATVIDDTAFFELQGIKITDVYATASVDKNGWYRAALDGNMEPLRAELDKFNEKFLALVEANRGSNLTQTRTEWGTGKVYSADEALTIGLIDQIGTFDDTLKTILNS